MAKRIVLNGSLVLVAFLLATSAYPTATPGGGGGSEGPPDEAPCTEDCEDKEEGIIVSNGITVPGCSYDWIDVPDPPGDEEDVEVSVDTYGDCLRDGVDEAAPPDWLVTRDGVDITITPFAGGTPVECVGLRTNDPALKGMHLWAGMEARVAMIRRFDTPTSGEGYVLTFEVNGLTYNIDIDAHAGPNQITSARELNNAIKEALDEDFTVSETSNPLGYNYIVISKPAPPDPGITDLRFYSDDPELVSIHATLEEDGGQVAPLCGN